MANDAQTLKKWQNYINKYEQNLQNHDFDLSTSSGRSSYTREEAHLNSLRSKYAYLQQYYAEYGELPPNVTFERIEGAGGAYRTEAQGEIKTITFEAGGNGGMTVSAPDFTGTYHWEGPPELIASSYAEREGSPQRYGIEVTGPAGAGYISMDVTGTLFAGMSSTYHFHSDTIPSRWTVSLNLNDTIPVYDQTSPLGMNAFTFNGGISWVLEEMTVPTDEPWRYYETKIKPNIPPGDDIFPNGYDPGSEDEPPEEGKPDPDEKDEGDPGVTHTTEMKNTMTKFYVLTPNIFQQFRQLLTETVQDSWNNPSDETGFLYLIGMLKKATGGMPEFETATSDFIGKYIVGCKAYPFNLRVAYTYRGQGYDDRNSPVNGISFGYNGASVPSATGTQFTEKPVPLLSNIMPSVFVRANCPNRAGNTNIGECTFLDFEPFTRYFIYLPYVGEFELPARQTVCATIYVQYDIDFSTGTAVAAVYAEGGYNTDETDNLTLLIKKTSTLGCSCSVAGNDIVKQGDQMVMASMGAQQSFVHSAVSDLNYMLDPLKNISSLTEGVGKSGSLEEGALKFAGNAAMYGFNRLLDVPNRVEEVFGNYQNMVAAGINKTQASRDIPFILGGGTNISPFTDKNTPVLRIQKSIAFYPDGFAHMYGYPKQNTMKLGNLTGYFQTASIDVSGIGGIDEPIPTEIEQKMINDALKSGSFMNNS